VPARITINAHELRVLKNGHYMVIASTPITGVDLTGLSLPLGGGSYQPLGPNSDIMDCRLIEFDPATSKVAWTWSGLDHFDPAADSTEPALNPNLGPDGGPLYDVFHCNSIDVEDGTNNLLVSSRNMDSVFYIEKKTGSVLWKMGGKAASKDGATHIPVDDPFYCQHDARFLPGWSSCSGGEGQISLFDDGIPQSSSGTRPARGVVLDVNVASGGSSGGDCGPPPPKSKAKVSWQYSDNGPSYVRGGFRISADGSRVIDWGDPYPVGTAVFTEVDEAKHDLVDLYFTNNDDSYRTVKIPLSTFDIAILRLAAGR